jgi:hypothetical protein
MPMESYAQFRLQAAQEQIQRRIREAEFERLAASARPPSSFRQSVGFSFIRIGERLAAEPSRFRPAPSR